MINKVFVLRKMRSVEMYVTAFLKWIFIALVIGVIGGFVGSFFHMAVNYATGVREGNSWLLFLLPVIGLVIVFMYRRAGVDEDMGTNLVISSIRTNIKVPLIMAPLIFVSTVLTHLCGGSVGREGAALQLGGSIGARLGERMHLDEKDQSIVIMCGMSGVFAALFGTPITATLFAMEVISVGVIYYVGLVPCIGSSLVAYKISVWLGLAPTKFSIGDNIPDVNLPSVLRITVLAIVCALVSIMFCVLMEYSHKHLKIYLKNTYLRIFLGGIVIILLTIIVGTRDYNGSGVEVITAAIEGGKANWEAFLLKMAFTAITIGAGYKGGEIVPTFFIGSTLGCTVAHLIGLDPCFGAAIGLVAMFCGVVNCPIASIFLSFELFGGKGLVMFVIACGISYMLSGYYSLYSSQKIMYSKIKPRFINKKAK